MKQDRSDALTLEILQAIEAQKDVTQRGLARDLGVALGLANSYLRRCVRKGLIKIKQAPANRYAYYLTPQGFAEKSRLTTEYLRFSLDYYHRAGRSVNVCLRAIAESGRRRVLFAGMSELAEIAFVRLHEVPLDIVGTLDPVVTTDRFLGHPVWRDTRTADSFDAILFTALVQPDRVYALLLDEVGKARIHVPDIVMPLLQPGLATN